MSVSDGEQFADDEIDLEFSEPTPQVEYTVKSVEDTVALIARRDPAWKPASGLHMGDLNWRPHLIDVRSNAILHVHVSERIYGWQRERLKAANEAGFRVHVALPIALLFEDEIVQGLYEADVEVHVLRGEQVISPRHLLAALADERVAVSSETRRIIAAWAWQARRSGSTYRRGRRFEALISFLLAQVDDFEIVERNFRGETDELDAVIQLTKVSARCWFASGAPFILVEAKNWVAPVTQKEVSAFLAKLMTKNGRSKLGLMFGAGGFTSDAATQVTKLAMSEYLIILIGPEDFSAWFADDDLTESLENYFRKAMLA